MVQAMDCVFKCDCFVCLNKEEAAMIVTKDSCNINDNNANDVNEDFLR